MSEASEESSHPASQIPTSKRNKYPVEKKKVYVSPDWVQSVLDGNQEESEDYMVLECASKHNVRMNDVRTAVKINFVLMQLSQNPTVRRRGD